MLVPDGTALSFGAHGAVTAPIGVQVDEMLSPGAVTSGW
jgi:hypothetical protein